MKVLTRPLTQLYLSLSEVTHIVSVDYVIHARLTIPFYIFFGKRRKKNLNLVIFRHIRVHETLRLMRKTVAHFFAVVFIGVTL